MQFHVGAACYTLLELCVTTCLKMLGILHLPCKINTTKPLNYTQGLYHFIKKTSKTVAKCPKHSYFLGMLLGINNLQQRSGHCWKMINLGDQHFAQNNFDLFMKKMLDNF